MSNIESLKSEKVTLLRNFLANKALPKAIGDAFMTAVNDGVPGMERLNIPAEDLLLALARDGIPCSAGTFQQRSE